MQLLIGCWIVQLVLAQAMPSPWWVPDLIVAGLIVAVIRQPSRWMTLSVMASLCQALWALRAPGQLMGSYLAVGGVTAVVHTRWDLTDRRLQLLLVMAASVMMTGVGFWLDEVWSAPIIAAALLRLGLTVISLAVITQINL